MAAALGQPAAGVMRPQPSTTTTTTRPQPLLRPHLHPHHLHHLAPHPATRPPCPPRMRPAPASSSSSEPSTGPGTPPKPSPPPNFFSAMFKNLQDFGIGRNSLLEGGVGLFVLVGAGAAVTLACWARGIALRTTTPYQLTVELPLACGVTVGTPLRIRGVQVGQVLNVKPSLQRVDVLCEVTDTATVIPRNSIIEANQSGLIAEPLLDVTPQHPIPTWEQGPTSPGCEAEGVIVCENGRIEGHQGVALDDLVYIMTQLARQAEHEGFDKVFGAAEAATRAIEESRPLLAQSIKLVEEVTPLLHELREGGLVANMEALTSTAAAAAADIQKLQGAVLTEENVRALRSAVLTLCRTMEHVESVSSDMSAFTRDSAVQRNLKTLVQALSRLVDE